MRRRPVSIGRGSTMLVGAILMILALAGAALKPAPVFARAPDPGSGAGQPAPAAITADAGWSALQHAGLSSNVNAIAFYGTDMYVGGHFIGTQGSEVELNLIGRYDLAANEWHALAGAGLNGTPVYALALHGDDLYVGGNFSMTHDGGTSDLNYIARYDLTEQTWYPLANEGLDFEVYALAFCGDTLYVGGNFSRTHDGKVDLSNIAAYSPGTGTWSALGSGTSHEVHALACSGSDLYVGGYFPRGIVKYNGGWSNLPNGGLDEGVRALVFDGSDLYAGGFFQNSYDGTVHGLNRIAKLSGGAWHALPNGGLDGGVSAIAFNDGNLYAGGSFGETADGSTADLNAVARLDLTGGAWHALPNHGLGMANASDHVSAIAFNGTDGFFGGGFQVTTDLSKTLYYIAKLSPGHVNVGPTANAGADQQAMSGRVVTLDGSASFDPDNNLPLVYHWSQTGGPAVTLSSPSAAQASFIAPLNTKLTALTFSLVVTDGLGADSPSDQVTVTIDAVRVYLPLAVTP